MIVPTGLAFQIPKGLEGQIRPRSGLAAKHSITVLNSPGTIDSDYRGEIKIILINHGRLPVSFEAGDRIAQMVFAYVARPVAFIYRADGEAIYFEEVEELEETVRGEGGFGSTGSS